MGTRYRADSTNLWLGAVFTVIGLLTLLGFFTQLNEWNEFKKTGVPVTAQITDIETYRTGSGKHRHTQHDVYITYSYNGTQYDGELDYYTSGMRPGKTVDILVDPAYPTSLMSSPTGSLIATGIFFLIFFGVGAGFLGNEARRSVVVKNLIDRDLYVVCRDWTEAPANVRVNHVRYRCIKAFYNDGMRSYEFTSRPYHPSRCPLMPGESVTVYVDTENPKDYYVDLAV